MKSKLLFSFIFLSSFVVAQVPLLTPFSTHKQSRITEISNLLDNLPSGFGAKYSDRIAWNSIKKSIDTTKIISWALSVSNSPMPPWNDSLFLDYSKTGLRAAGEKMLADRQNYLTPLVWAECIENKGRFTPFIINALKSLVTQPTWRMPASYKDLSDFYGRRNLEVDLGSADLVTILSQSLYFLDDKVDAVTHQQVVDSIYSRVLNPFKKTLDTGIYNYWLGGLNNIPAYCFSGIVGAALAVIQNKQERALFVAAAEYYSQNYLLGYSDDAYCNEGLGYYNYGFYRYIVLREEIFQKTQGKIDLFQSPKLNGIARYGLNLEITRGVYPAIGDCIKGTLPSTDILWYCNKNLGLGYSKYNYRTYTQPFDIFSSSMFLFPNTASLAAIPTSPVDMKGNGLRTCYDLGGVFISRPNDTNPATFAVCMQGGNNNEFHNHNDLGSYSLVCNDEMLVGDQGGPTNSYSKDMWNENRYTYKRLSSYGHPVPYINNTAQQSGATAIAIISKTNFTDKTDELVLDITSGYAVPTLQSLKRRFVYERSVNGRFIVEDSVKFSQAGTYETALTIAGNWQLKDKNTIEIEGKNNKLLVRIIPPSGVDFTLGSEKITDLGPEYTRIGIKLNSPIITGVFRLEFLNYPTLSEGFENFPLGTTPATGLVWSSNSATNDIDVQVVKNPTIAGINTSNNVLKIERLANNSLTNLGAVTYRGASTSSYDLSKANSCVFTLKVLKNYTGKLGMRIYYDNINCVEIISPEIQASAAWQLVKFDFTDLIKNAVTINARLCLLVEKTITPSSRQTAALTLFVDDVNMIESRQLNANFEYSDASLWTQNTGTPALVAWEIVPNPKKDQVNGSDKVLKVIKYGGPTSGNWNNVNSTYYLPRLTKDSCVVEMKILFRSSENSIQNSKMAVRLAASATGELYNTVTVSDSWQKIQYDYSLLSDFAQRFNQNKDTTLTNFSFFPRRDIDQLSSVVVYIDDVKIVPKITTGVEDVISPKNQVTACYDKSKSLITFRNLPDTPCTVVLYNLMGVERKKTNLDPSNAGINVAGYTPGIYFVSCFLNGAKIYTGKVIVN